jgi:hypothetical protein
MTASSSFGRVEFNAFLFASVGEDKSGVELTVLSALTRLGFDPWQEAARLSELPRETAARTLASAFALLPEGDWKIPQMGDLAAKLVDCLPRPGALSLAIVAKGQPAGKATSWLTMRPPRWLFWLAIAVGWYFVVSHLTANPVFDSSPSVSTPSKAP